MHLELSKEQEKKLKDFSHEVIERNKQHNLTGHKDAKTFYNLQVVDCISAYSVCKKTVAENIVDCGSGAGLPSVVWAILSPEKKFYSIDKNEKKIQFQLARAGTGRLSRRDSLAGPSPGQLMFEIFKWNLAVRMAQQKTFLNSF